MRETLIIMRRELKSYFISPIAYVFGALFLVAQMVFTAETLTQGLPANMRLFFVWLPLVFLGFLPALTMRSWSEERKLGTLELLMTFPVTIRQLIVGKFLASLAYLALILALTFGLPYTLSLYGDLDLGPVAGAYIASLLLASSYIAVGMFWSSLTRDQIVAFLLTLVTLAALSMLGQAWFLSWLSAWKVPETVILILSGISPIKYFSSITRGVLDTRDVVYYLSFCGFFLYANALVLRGRRFKG